MVLSLWKDKVLRRNVIKQVAESYLSHNTKDFILSCIGYFCYLHINNPTEQARVIPLCFEGKVLSILHSKKYLSLN